MLSKSTPSYSQHGELFWVNAGTQPSHNKIDKAFINRHVQKHRFRHERQKKQAALRDGSQPARAIARVGWTIKKASPAENPIDSSSLADDRNSISSESEDDSQDDGKFRALEHEGDGLNDSKLGTLTIIGKGQGADPFGMSAMSVHPDALRLIHFYFAWTLEDCDTHAQVTKHVFASESPPSGSAPIVQNAMHDSVRMWVLLTYIASLMQERRPSILDPRNRTIITQRALAAFRERVVNGGADLIYDTAFLGSAAMHQRDHRGVMAHLHATKYLVDAAGGFDRLPPYLVPTILAPDLAQAIAGLRKPIFDLSGAAYLNAFSPLPWRADPRLACALRSAEPSVELDEQLRQHVHALIQVAHVLLHFCTHPAQHLNAAWASWRCVLICMDLLSSSSSSSTRRTAASPDRANEASRVTILLWALWLGSGPVARGPGRRSLIKFEHSMLFLYRFDEDVIRWYERWGCAGLCTALRQMNGISERIFLSERLDQDEVFGAFMGVLTELEDGGGGEVRLGSFMAEFVRLERGTRGVGLGLKSTVE